MLPTIEGIPVTPLKAPSELFQRLLDEIDAPGQSTVGYLNVHVANQSIRFPRLKRFLQRANFIYCDGAGILLASHLLGQPLPTRLTAADWFVELLATLAAHGKRVFIIAGRPGVAEKAQAMLAEKLENSPLVGVHHGYINSNPALESALIRRINQLKPDLLIVGMGTPYQEDWIRRVGPQLEVSVLYAMGATLDFLTGEVNRCPEWMADTGLEWMYRFSQEPRRLFFRYVVGNPWFFTRLLLTYAVAQFRKGLSELTIPSTTPIPQQG